MKVYSETLDPSETKDYAFDWTPKLAPDELVTSHVVTFIDAAGTTSPQDSVTSPFSKVWLAGGVHGGRVIYTIVATTNQGRTIDDAFAVDVVDNAIGPVELTEADRIRSEIAAAKVLRAKLVAGDVIEDFMRDGRRVRRKLPSLKEITDTIVTLERELAEAVALASGQKRRRPIALAWRN